MSATNKLMILLVIVFALQCINDVYIHSTAEMWLSLSSGALLHGWVWQFITFQFLHGGLLHILFNLIGLFYFGRFAENVMGARRMLLAFFGTGLVGGLLQAILMIVFPSHFLPWVVGASAGCYGLFAIFAELESDQDILLYFVLPVKARTILWIAGGISLFFTLVPSPREMGVAHAAHLGGILAGLAWVRMGWHRDFVPLPGAEWLASLKRRSRPARASARRAKPAWIAPEEEPSESVPQGEFISREVDPILDKISAHGIHSLTDHERKVLEKARAKMARR